MFWMLQPSEWWLAGLLAGYCSAAGVASTDAGVLCLALLSYVLEQRDHLCASSKLKAICQLEPLPCTAARYVPEIVG